MRKRVHGHLLWSGRPLTQCQLLAPPLMWPAWYNTNTQYKYSPQIHDIDAIEMFLIFTPTFYKSHQLHGISKLKRLSSTSGRMFIKFNCTSSTVKLPHLIFLCKFVCSCIYWSFLMSVIFPSARGWKHTSGLLTLSFAPFRRSSHVTHLDDLNTQASNNTFAFVPLLGHPIGNIKVR